MKKFTIYLAGPISGDPNYQEKFARVEAQISDKYAVINPAKLPQGMSNKDYMRICLPALLTADVALFLPGWEKSPGARIEHFLAEYVRLQIVHVPKVAKE